jgi:hypothetical protein
MVWVWRVWGVEGVECVSESVRGVVVVWWTLGSSVSNVKLAKLGGYS